MPISQSIKVGTSVDTGDLLTQRKRDVLNQVIESKKALGIYKPSLTSRGFELVNLQRQTGIDSLLVRSGTPVHKLFAPRFFRRG
jgi:hypothetical protein